jgi:hypothetical protein
MEKIQALFSPETLISLGSWRAIHRVNLDLAIWQSHLGDVELAAFEC